MWDFVVQQMYGEEERESGKTKWEDLGVEKWK